MKTNIVSLRHYFFMFVSDPYFVPEVHIKSTGPSSVNIAWDRLPVNVKQHVHFFKLLMFNEDVRKETLVNPSDYYTTYAFTDLKSATTYNFSVNSQISCISLSGLCYYFFCRVKISSTLNFYFFCRWQLVMNILTSVAIIRK